MSAVAIEAVGLEKWYGPLPAVRGLSFTVASGEFLTIFGPNGAGKSTLLRMLAGAVRPTRGEVLVGGEPIGQAEQSWRRKIGVLSHQSFLYEHLSAEENLHFYGKLYGVENRAARVAAMLERVGLWERRADLVRNFSRGMHQRLALARTLLHEPQVALLDEPYTGLDPHAAVMLRGVLEQLKDGHRTVVMVTHNLSQGLELADRVVVQSAGRWLSDESRAEIESAGFERVYSERVGGVT